MLYLKKGGFDLGNTSGILLEIGDFDLYIHQSILVWFGIGIFVCILFTWGGKVLAKADPSKAPKGAVFFFEFLAECATGTLGPNLHKRLWDYLPILGTMMVMVVLSNLIGLIGLQSPTSNLSVVIVLVAIMIIMIHGTDIKKHGIVGKLKSYLEPVALLLPLNIVGDMAFPLALCLRLFGNMLAGSVIVSLLYFFIKSIMPFGVLMYIATPFLHMYFDIWTAGMQTYIFFTLGSFFIGQSADAEDE